MADDQGPQTLSLTEADELEAAIKSNDLARMSKFIGHLPEPIEQEFREIRARQEAENRALIGGLLDRATDMLRVSATEASMVPRVKLDLNALALSMKMD